MQNAKLVMPEQGEALPGRADPMPIPETHFVNGKPLAPPYPDGFEWASFGLGCFWGAERLFWELDGVWVTAAGYAGGFTPNPTYEEVCSGRTGHAEVVRVVWDPARISFAGLLKAFWEAHDPSQGFRQGNDIGTQYRSALYCTTKDQLGEATASRAAYDHALRAAGHPPVTTEVESESAFYFAEDYHQQYLAKNPGGYCGLKGTGISCVG